MKTERMRKKNSLTKAVRLGVGDRLRTIRFHLDRSPAQFASLVGADVATVEGWERGEGIDRTALVSVADRTGACLLWLISGLASHRLEAIREAAFTRPPAAASPAPGLLLH